MEIVVTGRNVEVPEHFRVHVAEKVARLERYDHRMVGMEVELFHERNRRQSKSCQRVEITGRGCDCVARAEACAQDFYGALDAAIAKLESQLRRSHDRRRVTSKRTRVTAGRGAGTAVLDEAPPIDMEFDGLDDFPALNGAPLDDAAFDGGALNGRAVNGNGRALHDSELDIPAPREHHEEIEHARVDPDPVPGRVVRRKAHTDSPMTVDDALARMELVGHDFYLFADADSGKPCVVYRRKGYDYGVISLAR